MLLLHCRNGDPGEPRALFVWGKNRTGQASQRELRQSRMGAGQPLLHHSSHLAKARRLVSR
jgi:hypothetical protein